MRAADAEITVQLIGGESGARDRLIRIISESGIPCSIEEVAESHAYISRLAVRGRSRVTFVRTSDVEWIEADDTRIRIHTATETHELRERLSDLEQLLSPREFTRVHRGAIVRIDRIREVQPWFRGDYVIILASGTKVTTGHTYRAAVRALLRHH